jgi:hypothetical protein
MDRVASLEVLQVDFNKGRQILRQAGYFDVVVDVRDVTATDLDARRDVGVDEVQRHTSGGWHGSCRHAENPRAGRVACRGASASHAAGPFDAAIDVQRQNGRMKRFLAQVEQNFVVIDVDQLRFCRATVNDGRHRFGATQAAARSGPLQGALVRIQIQTS